MEKQELEKEVGKVWETEELMREFDVKGFLAPFVVVVRKEDNQKGSMEFQHSPRYYYSFVPDSK